MLRESKADSSPSVVSIHGRIMSAPPLQLLGLDPLFWAQVKLFVSDVLALTPHPDVKGTSAARRPPPRTHPGRTAPPTRWPRANARARSKASAEVYCYGTHPLRVVRVFGQVVAVAVQSKAQLIEIAGVARVARGGQ